MIWPISNSIILKSLFLAPIPLFFILFFAYTYINKKYASMVLALWNNLHFFLIAFIIIWLIYCVLVVPIAYATSTFLNKHKLLYLWIILVGASLITPLTLVVLQLIFTHNLSLNDWENFFFPDDFIFMGACAVFTAFCYWCFLKILAKK